MYILEFKQWKIFKTVEIVHEILLFNYFFAKQKRFFYCDIIRKSKKRKIKGNKLKALYRVQTGIIFFLLGKSPLLGSIFHINIHNWSLQPFCQDY